MKKIVLMFDILFSINICSQDAAESGIKSLVLGSGCFWGAEKGFWKLPGVENTAVGYAGSDLQNPTYDQVCSGRTGHTEVVRIVCEKSIIHLSDLLKMFWECHDPTQINRQGLDIGTQYRSVIFYFSENAHVLFLCLYATAARRRRAPLS